MTSAAVALPASGAAVELHYRVWRSDFRVLVPNATIAGYLERVCAQFAAAEPAGDAIALEAGAGAGGWEIRRDGEPPVVRKTERGVAQHLEWRMVGIAARAEQRFIHWHAAALVRGEHTLLLPAKSGAGKSTLALALALQGFELLGEDVVFMDPESGVIHPFPRAPHVDKGSRALLERLGMRPDPDARLGNLLAPSVLTSWRSRPSPPLSHVLFVEWDEVGPVEVAPMTQAEAAVELRARSHTLRRQPEESWPILRRVLAPTRCQRLLRSEDLASAARAIRAFVDGAVEE